MGRVCCEREKDITGTRWAIKGGPAQRAQLQRLTTVMVICDGYCFEWWMAFRAATPNVSS